MPRDLNPLPLSETEQHQLRRLLDRSGTSLAAAQEARDKERAEERRLRARQDKLAAEEGRLARRLAQLHVDIDTVSAQLFQLAPSGVAFRSVNEQLQKLGTLVPTQSFFNSRFDTLDQKQIRLLAEIGLAMYQDQTRPRGGKSLRERMADVKVDIGRDAPGDPGGPSDARAELAARIIAAGKKRRNEP